MGYGVWEIAIDMKYRRLAQRSCVGSVWVPENPVPGVVVEVSVANVGAEIAIDMKYRRVILGSVKYGPNYGGVLDDRRHGLSA